ncbi:MAG: 4Fe-4S dicluster domain-containing protein [Desulfobacterales bacterium]|nr:4Fe-4S dicluster domain-containing protein [Desulfobacterales bacterium]
MHALPRQNEVHQRSTCSKADLAFKDKAAKLMYLFQNGGIVTDQPTLASMCVKCEKCLDKCPQDLPIPDLLEDVQEDMEGIFTTPIVWLGKRAMKVKNR